MRNTVNCSRHSNLESASLVLFPINHHYERTIRKSKIPLLVALLGISLFFSSSHVAYAVSNSNDNSLKILQKTKFADSKYKVMFSVCNNQSAKNEGVLISSNTEKVPVLINSNISKGECKTYGANILTTDPASIKISFFEKADIKKLAAELEKKISDLEAKRIKTYQELLRSERETSDKKADTLKQEVKSLEDRITSAKINLKILRSIK